MWFQILFTFVCLAAAIAVTALITTNNREIDGKAAPGWWLVSIGISQIFLVVIFAVWWQKWFATNQWVMYISGGIACVAVILWAIAKIYTRRHW